MLKVKDKYDYRQELATALRSGKYVQKSGSMGLHSETNKCTIGVAMDLGLVSTGFGWATEFREKFGIEVGSVINRNDFSHNFNELAFWLENLP